MPAQTTSRIQKLDSGCDCAGAQQNGMKVWGGGLGVRRRSTVLWGLGGLAKSCLDEGLDG
jgi:hypothetical protein